MHIELVIYVNLYSRSGIDGKAFREILSLRNDLDFGQAFIEKGSRFLILTFPKGPHRPCGIKTRCGEFSCEKIDVDKKGLACQ